MDNTGPSCSSPANPHQTQTSLSCPSSRMKWGRGQQLPAVPIQYSLASWPHPNLSLCAHSPLNVGSIPLPLPDLLGSLEGSIKLQEKRNQSSCLFINTGTLRYPTLPEQIRMMLVPIMGLGFPGPLFFILTVEGKGPTYYHSCGSFQIAEPCQCQLQPVVSGRKLLSWAKGLLGMRVGWGEPRKEHGVDTQE